eukprot:TRINITY_DN9529_c0_g1_i1.p1 TRINITY_DN9529_c0_g1~~TRINITY_DN9529_c0_g1_i1.p1  ORF type:complete len:743 (-),score=171.61 TRINITY_DN9529_c0_g1_i1:447-2675(-)
MARFFAPLVVLLVLHPRKGLAFNCWAGDFTAATCCDKSHGPKGNPSCWDGTYTFERCCGGGRSVAASSSSSQNQGAVSRRKSADIDGIVVGIDLGTTYSAVAVYRNDKVEVIANDQGNRITPSIVAFLESGERLVGEAAKNQLADNPKNTIYDAKRLIGRGFQDRSVQFDKKSLPFRVVDRRGRPHIELDKNLKKMVLAPEEVSALVLRKMKGAAEAFLGEEVRHAVVTVPAYFNDNQRSATMVAGEIAGLNIVRIINEPTAAAIAFGLDKQKRHGRGETRVLVYDLGGGTFDVSLLLIADGVFETMATCGNTHLGGEDFDRNVLKHVIEQFKKKTGKDPSSNVRAMQRLRVEVERAKRALSTSHQTRLEVEAFFEGLDLQEELTRSKFENLNADLFSKTLEPVKRVLKDAQVSKNEIDEVVMVGGSTRIPKIQQLIKEFFGLKKLPKHTVNPDEAVAAGAAIQGWVLWRGSAAGTAVGAYGGGNQIVLVDVTPLSLGIEIQGGHMVTLIPRNTHLPTKKTKTFTTSQDQQTSVYIPIFEGERPIAAKNSKLGEMVLSGIPPAPIGVPQIEVTFRIDANGILHVTAEDLATRKPSTITINADKGRLSEEEVERMVKKAQKFAEKDREILSRNDARASLRAYLHSLESSILQAEALSQEDKEDLESAIQSASQWLEQTGKATADEIREQRQAVEEVANPIISRMYGGSGSSTSSSSSSGGGDDAEAGPEEDVYDQDAMFNDEL